MALIVLDPCDVGFMPNPEGGTLKIFNVQGFPEGLEFLIPFPDETLQGIKDVIDKKLNTKLVVAGAHEMPGGGSVG